MPQLFSRTDNMNWLTPAIADILDQGTPPPGGDGSIRDQMLELQKRFDDLETPVKVINVRPTPSYTLFMVRPESVGRLGNRRNITTTEIKKSLGQIAEEKREWRLGFVPQLPEVADAVGIMLRTSAHKPLNLRRMLVRSSFRDHRSLMALAIGNTLEQQLVLADMADIGHILIVGDSGAKKHFLRSTLMTLVMLNTPGELRIALAGTSTEDLKQFASIPHILGRNLTDFNTISRLLNGLFEEMNRRREALSNQGMSDMEAYNATLIQSGQSPIPRIMIIVDSLSDAVMMQNQMSWLPIVEQLLRYGNKVGVHLILTANENTETHVAKVIDKYTPLKFILSTSADEITDKIENFHGSQLRFIDGFWHDTRTDTTQPVEIATVADDEINEVVTYWQQAAAKRDKEENQQRVSGKTGVTQALDPSVVEEYVRRKKQQASEDPEQLNQFTDQTNSPPQVSLQQAQALAAYLGWIGIGPLQDVLGMSSEEAKRTITVLRVMGIVEDGTSPTPRFLRLIN